MLKAKLVNEILTSNTAIIKVYQTEMNPDSDIPAFEYLMVTAVRLVDEPLVAQTAAYICADKNGAAITGTEPFAALSIFSPEVLLYQMGYGLV